MAKLKTYYSLTKPHVTYGNLLTTIAGFLLACAHVKFDLLTFVATTVGMFFVIGSACAFNNYFDQDIDSVMERTKKRAIVAGEIEGKNALIFASIVAILGFFILIFFTNFLTVAAALIGFSVYIVLYGMISKRLSMHGTLVGSVSGAMPIVAGYVAATNTIDVGMVLLFLVLFFWQVPEFYSIAIYRQKEYAVAKIPVISVVKNVQNVKIQILAYMMAFTFCALALTLFGYTGYIYLLVMTVLSARWIWMSLQGFTAKNNDIWAKGIFKFSLIVLVIFSLLISLEAFLP